jgi:NDP-sugar pyrophosphorylase family protein
MVRVLGKPFLEFEIQLLAKAGVTDFILCVGYMGQTIVDYFGDGSRFAVKIHYSLEGEKLLGPSGALKKATPLLHPNFFVTYGDAYLPFDYQSAMSKFEESGKLGMMVVYENHNRFGRSDVVVEKGYVQKYDKHNQTPKMVWINYGVSFLKVEALDLIPYNQEVSEEEFYGKLIAKRQLLAHETKNRFYEIGTPETLKEFERLMQSDREIPKG